MLNEAEPAKLSMKEREIAAGGIVADEEKAAMERGKNLLNRKSGCIK